MKCRKHAVGEEILFCITSILIGFSLCSVYGHSLEDPLDHPIPITMSMFYPSIFFAGGHGLGTASPEDIPGLKDFVARRTDSFDVTNIPDDVTVVPVSDFPESSYLYHLYVVGWFWRIFGVSVQTLLIYASCIYALSAGVLYLMFRNGLGRLASLTGTLLVCSSPAMLYTSVNLRDFAKTPFVIFAIYILIKLIVCSTSRKSLPALAILLGVTCGIGVGFRQDVVMCLPPAIMAILLSGSREGSHSWHLRLISVGLLLLAFIPLSRPIFRGMALEGNQASAHGFFQGLSEEVEARLAFGGASYDFLVWTDSGLYSQANVFSRRQGVNTPMINPGSMEYRHAIGDAAAPFLQNPGLHFTGAEYARFQRILMRDVLLTFPADIVARAWRTAAALYEMPSALQQELSWVKADFPSFVRTLFAGHKMLSSGIRMLGLLFVAAGLIGVSAINLKKSLGLTGLLIWFSGYPSINYEYRMIAYLVFIPFLGFLFCFSHAGRRVFICIKSVIFSTHGVQAEHTQSGNSIPFLKSIRNMAILVATVLMAMIIPLIVLRAWQKDSVYKLASQLETLKLNKVEIKIEKTDARVLVSPTDVLPGLKDAESLPPGETAWQYVAAVFDTNGENIPIGIEYDKSRVFNDYTQQLNLYGSKNQTKGRVTLFFPVYEGTTLFNAQVFFDFLETFNFPEWHRQADTNCSFEEQALWRRSRFLGLSFPEASQGSFKGLYYVTGLDGLNYLPFFQLPEEMENLRLYKLGPWERWMRSHFRLFKT